MKIQYAKEGFSRYLSHLDLMNILHRLLKISGIPMKFSEGFNPRPRVIMLPPLPLGLNSSEEWIFCQLTRPLEENEVLVMGEKFSSTCPSGLKVTEFFVTDEFKSPQVREERFLLNSMDPGKILEFLTQFLEQKNFPYSELPIQVSTAPDLEDLMDERGKILKVSWTDERKIKKKETRILDINPLILGVEVKTEGIYLNLKVPSPTEDLKLPSNGKWLRCFSFLVNQQNLGPAIRVDEITRIGVKFDS